MRFAVGFLAAACATLAHAGVISSNLGPGGSFATSSWVVGTSSSPFGSTTLEVAAAFIASTDAIFTGAEFAVESLGGFGALTVALTTTGPLGTPDAALETFHLQGPSSPTLMSVQSTVNPLLSAGAEYWLDISAPFSTGEWFDNNLGMRGPVAVNQNQLGFVLLTDFGGNPPVQPAFQIDGNPVGFSAAIAPLATALASPEPSSVFLVIGGLLVFLGQRALSHRTVFR